MSYAVGCHHCRAVQLRGPELRNSLLERGETVSGKINSCGSGVSRRRSAAGMSCWGNPQSTRDGGENSKQVEKRKISRLGEKRQLGNTE